VRQVTTKTDEPIPEAIHYLIFLDNGYGASIIDWRNCREVEPLGYILELAVINYDQDEPAEFWDSRFNLDYDTPITDDVICYLDEDSVFDLVRQIGEL